MKNREDRTLKATPETNSRYESTESHLFDTDATEEKALCGADTSAAYRRAVGGYLESRLYGHSVGRHPLRGVQSPGRPIRREPHP